MSWLSEAVHQISWSGVGGIIFGAGISATISYALQRNSFAEARRQKESDKREERRALGLNVLTKMIRLSSNIVILKRTIESSFERAKADKLESPPWAVVVPLANLPAKVHFEPKELTEVLRLDFELFNNIGPFDDVHNALVDAFEMYRTERTALTGQMKADVTGQLGLAKLTQDELRTFGPKMAGLDALIAQLLKRTTIDADEGGQLLVKLQDALNKEFDLKISLELKPPVHQD
jgi:hypothetical protein